MKRSHTAPFFRNIRHATKALNWCLVVLLTTGTLNTTLQAQAPAGGTVRAGDATITGDGTASMRIDQRSARAIIDWRQFSIGADGRVVFAQPTPDSATLNRVTGAQVSVILGTLDANGQVLLINPNGIVFGGGAQVNVGSLIATTSNISDTNFLAGRLVFDQPGRPGAGILNRGALTARDGGLVALVAPHVRNDGLLAARLGTVVLGSADTFTVDLYGDALINLAISNGNAGQLVGLDGRSVASLVTNSGRIDAAGGQTVLMTARGAKAVLDNLINMSGTIKADAAVEQNGRILLLGEGGTVDVSGALSASGGTIQVLGDQVHLAGTAALDVSGEMGGGTVLVGGAFQGRGDTYRSIETTVDAGATLKASATAAGNGGEVVVWSDGNTAFAGAIEVKGGAAGGNGGLMEVSGKGTLNFLGQADASAANGQPGSLLLDPAYMTIGAAEASTITRVLRTGTTTNLQADVDIDVNSAIFGGDREEGGGLNMTAGNNINVNDFVVTNNGAINMTATRGTVTVADGKAVFAGNAPITVNANGNLSTGPMLTSGSLSIRSVAGSVAVNSFIDDHTGSVSIKAAGNVDLNQAIVNLASGSALTVEAGQDVNVNAQVDGRGGVAGGAVRMTAARDVNVNQAVVTNNGAVALTATNGALNVTSGAPLVSGTGAMALTASNDVSTGAINAGALAITSSAGTVNVNGVIDSATGETRINAGADVNLNQAVLNGQSGSALAVDAGRDVNVNAAIDGRSGVAGGSVTLTGARHVTVRDHVITNNGAIGLTASSGSLTVAPDSGTFSGDGAITMRAAGELTTGVVSGGSLDATSTGASVNINGVIDGNTGRVDLTAANDVNLNRAVLNSRTGRSLDATAGRDVNVNAGIDGRGGNTGGSVVLNASRDVDLNSSIITNNGGITLSAITGAITMATGTSLVSGDQAILIEASGDVTTRGISGGSLRATSRNGNVIVDGVIDGATGRVDLAAGRDVTINAAVLNTRTGASLNAAAGQNVNVNARIDGTGGASGGSVNLTANRNVNVNAVVTTHDAAIRLTATNGTTAFANGTGLYAGSGAIVLDALGSIVTPTLSGGAMSIASRGGSIDVGAQMAGTGPMNIGAAATVNVNNAITNAGAASALVINAGTDIHVNAAIGRIDAGLASGPVTLVANQNVTLSESIVTGNGDISVAALYGWVTMANDEGIHAGSGDVLVQSGQTLVTPTVSTTGDITLLSTAGSVDVDTAIAGASSITIGADVDVNVNQAISNALGSTLYVSAGNDINVNAAIDGRDPDDPMLASGSTTLVAGRNVNLATDIVTVDAGLTVAATDGTVHVDSHGLFAGTGDIGVYAGSTLDTGVTTTTGALTLASTNGDVNINTAISDTTGDVTISAGATVNINQAITNLASGASLTVDAGTDINALAAIDGRSGTAEGGSVVMTAGNDVTLTGVIATNNGDIDIAATEGTVVLPVGAEVVTSNVITTPMVAVLLAGDGDVRIQAGGDFDFTSPVLTTGTLTIASTDGDVTTSAPIVDTGAVVISAGDELVVDREIRSANADVTLVAGAGGLTINQIDDHDGTLTSSVNAGNADLTLNSGGDVSVLDSRGISSQQTVTIDARGRLVTGRIGDATTTPTTTRPQVVNLNADAGIVSFDTGKVGDVNASSSGGSITITVASPDRLRIVTGTPGTTDCPACDITLTSSAVYGAIGPDVILNAGGSVIMPNFFSSLGDVTMIGRSGDVRLNSTVVNGSFVVAAGRDVVMSNLMWVGSPAAGDFTVTAGRDLVTGPDTRIHVTNGDLTVVANRNLTLYLLETLGNVSLTATTGNVTLNNDIGPTIINNNSLIPDYNPNDLGVAALTLAAGGSVNMQGARAEGDVSITAGGDLTAARAITSVNGTVTLDVDGTTTLHQDVPIGTQEQLVPPGAASPVASPGPRAPLPAAPGVASNAAAGLPVFAEINVSAAEQSVGAISQPGGANGTVGLGAVTAGAFGPGAVNASGARPAAPNGSSVSRASGSSDPTSLDTAAALRAAGAACGEEQTGDTGLNAIAPVSGAAAADQKQAACPPAAQAGQAAGAATPSTATAGAAPTGGGLQ